MNAHIDVEKVAAVADLHVTFEGKATVQAVSGVSFEVRRGEVLAVVGESGSGKSVTANTLLGLLPVEALIDGAVIVRDWSGHPTDVLHASAEELRRMRGRDAAMVFQEPSLALNPVFTVGWQISEGLRAHEKLSKAEARQRAIDALRKVGIPEPERRVDDYPHQFSGGQKQRIVIAMALVLNAGLIIADEPTTALDVTVQAEILELLRSCRDEFGATILMITHNMGVVADIADRVIVMYKGNLVEEASVDALFDQPQEDYTMQLLAAVPHVGQGKSLTQDPGDLAPVEPDGDCPVRARSVRIGYPGRFGAAGTAVVHDVDLWVGPGEVLGLVGESGSGKSTIGRAMVGLTHVMGGSLTVMGHELNGVTRRQLAAIRRDVGLVFQDPATSFNPFFTIAECIAEPLVIHRMVRSMKEARPRVARLLEDVQLPARYAERYPHELSGGERQRVSLARALSLEPKLLIADEPTSALDVSVQARVLELFSELQAEHGFACLFISHDLAVIDRVADRVVVLKQGRVREQGWTGQVLNHPRDPYTQQLLSALPVPDPAEQRERRRLWLTTRERSA